MGVELKVCHFHRVLGRRAALQRALEVEDDDRRTAIGSLPQRRHHLRVIFARGVADGEDHLCRSKSSSETIPLPMSDGERQADARRLVAHIRAVGEQIAEIGGILLTGHPLENVAAMILRVFSGVVDQSAGIFGEFPIAEQTDGMIIPECLSASVAAQGYRPQR
jgi:hypothetical protein